MDNDDQQFHHYQQNEQPHLLITVLAERKKRLQHMTLEIQVLTSDMYKDVAGCVGLWDLNPSLLINGSQAPMAIHR
jgi:hypothetical protein